MASCIICMSTCKEKQGSLKEAILEACDKNEEKSIKIVRMGGVFRVRMGGVFRVRMGGVFRVRMGGVFRVRMGGVFSDLHMRCHEDCRAACLSPKFPCLQSQYRQWHKRSSKTTSVEPTAYFSVVKYLAGNKANTTADTYY